MVLIQLLRNNFSFTAHVFPYNKDTLGKSRALALKLAHDTSQTEARNPLTSRQALNDAAKDLGAFLYVNIKAQTLRTRGLSHTPHTRNIGQKKVGGKTDARRRPVDAI